jgi:hypothetical protein
MKRTQTAAPPTKIGSYTKLSLKALNMEFTQLHYQFSEATTTQERELILEEMRTVLTEHAIILEEISAIFKERRTTLGTSGPA